MHDNYETVDQQTALVDVAVLRLPWMLGFMDAWSHEPWPRGVRPPTAVGGVREAA